MITTLVCKPSLSGRRLEEIERPSAADAQSGETGDGKLNDVGQGVVTGLRFELVETLALDDAE